MTRLDVVLACGAVLAVLATARLLTERDLVRAVIALNIASGGVMMVLIAIASRAELADPVPQAMVLTGIVITAAVTGLALALIRRIEAEPHDEAGPGRQDDEP